MLDVILGLLATLITVFALPASTFLSCANRKPDVRPKKGMPMAPNTPSSCHSQNPPGPSSAVAQSSAAPETSIHQSVSAEPVKTVEKTQTLSVHTPKNATTVGKPEPVKPVSSTKGSAEEDDSYSNVSQLEDHGPKSKHPIISIVRGADGSFEQRVTPTPMATGH